MFSGFNKYTFMIWLQLFCGPAFVTVSGIIFLLDVFTLT